ncbi:MULTISPECIES: lipopolysaccharide heptosyltransferase I [unclassified Mesorhizobium]|uniref:lipopolysaccharide heptosyltransferase I n=1 Tax=unclassified Mesorhizobium TaxID=325217 RepID=UPI000BAEC292|nr:MULTISPECIES: lipopolysaccharide heptosyltransferase I [unclassified Mesorhizobium]TGT57382.1 lipopolysaccharide heptosyltransferase I [Mesorhizobium sp. M00.F.Ca.ET.170.01.1.1]AZO11886.1 lipopolysaccharide heptosyltransferase I [Mesorhizobium sp. M3A.F.Ca.ET.080.04.2.1]PBB86219.1 lipopolysaccharide heptosyltransferase I [Mesorhizobium sp. WSM3876]RWB73167.1 MAG: lipopolysaccharide heptosyltransferase I [Mesorhizobium sp.]RWB82694.1 MAG: lipopolysaccharide heptosyltransferase I [Mesorhizobi
MRVLIVKTSSMGDVIHSFPAVEDALQNCPGLSFDWCVEEAFAGIVAMHPAIKSIHKVAIRRWRRTLFNGQTWREMAVLRRTLRTAHYDLVIDAQGLLKSAVVARQAGTATAGFDRSSAREPSATLFYNRRYAVPRDLHAIERTRRLFGLALGYEPDLSRLGSGIVPPQGKLPLPEGRLAFLLHGTSREDKKWPVEDWTETARQMVSRHLTPVVTWSNEAEKRVAEAIASAAPGTVLIPRSPLVEIAAILGRSALVIGADTGLTHLASAFGLPTVAIFLATEPGLTGPRGPYSSTLLASDGGKVTPAKVMAEAEMLMQRQTLDQTAGAAPHCPTGHFSP